MKKVLLFGVSIIFSFNLVAQTPMAKTQKKVAQPVNSQSGNINKNMSSPNIASVSDTTTKSAIRPPRKKKGEN